MKKLGFFNKIMLFFNWLVAFLLVVAFILPYVPPKSFPIISLLSLTVSPLIVLNFIFLFYWLLVVRRQLWISAFVLVISYFHFNSFYEISSEKNSALYTNSLRILSYNVRLFNAYEKIQNNDPEKMMSTLLTEQNPDVIILQEYHSPNKVDFSAYKYSYIHSRYPKAPLAHAIFSKYPIINKGAFNFNQTSNNVLYADIVKNSDTLRLYNLHLQSLKIIPGDVLKGGEDETKMFKRISLAFQIQQDQVANILAHKAKSPYPVILSGDFNNTPFSYTYQKLHATMKDGFVKRGNGLGTTFLFDKYPMRIDFIFADEALDFLKFQNITKTFSDHYPIVATVGWKKKVL